MNSPFDSLDHTCDTSVHSQDGWDFGDLTTMLGRSFFQDQHGSGPVFGTPAEDRHNWVEQTTPFTCAVVSQEMILHAFGINASESQLTYEATANGWLSGGGTSMENMSRLLELHGVESHTVSNGSIDSLVNELAQGHKVIAAVDSSDMWKTGSIWDDIFQSHHADHAIVITGLDIRDSAHPKVYINDPGDPAGAGKAYPLDEFLTAWGDGGNLFVATDHAPTDLGSDSLFGANFDSARGMYMNGDFWVGFLANIARVVVTDAFTHLAFPWHSTDGTADGSSPWDGMSSTDRNNLFMQI